MSPRNSCITTLANLLLSNKSCLFVCFPGYENQQIVERVKRCLGPQKCIQEYSSGYLTPEDLESILANSRRDRRNIPCLALITWKSLRDLLISDRTRPYVVKAFHTIVCQNPHIGELTKLSEKDKHIAHLSGGHPVLVARVKAFLSHDEKKDLERKITQDKIARQQMEEITGFLDDTETGILKKLGNGKGLNPEERHIVQHWLSALGLVQVERNGYRVFSDVFQLYLQYIDASANQRGFVRHIWSYISNYSNCFLILLSGAIGMALLWLLGAGTFGLSAVLLASVVLLGRLVRRLLAGSTDTGHSSLANHEAIADDPEKAVRKGLLQELWALIEQTLILPLAIRVPMWIVFILLAIYTSILIRSYFDRWEDTITVPAASIFPGILSEDDSFHIEFPMAVASNATEEIVLYPSMAITVHYEFVSIDLAYVYQFEYKGGCNTERVLRPEGSTCTIEFKTRDRDRSLNFPEPLPVQIKVRPVGKYRNEEKVVIPPEEIEIHQKLPGTFVPMGATNPADKWWRFWAHVLVILSEAVLVVSGASYIHRHMNGGRRPSRSLVCRKKQKEPFHASDNSRLRQVWKECFDQGRIVSCVEVCRDHSEHVSSSR